MFCGECGTENPDTNQFCKNCGKPLKKKQLQPGSVPARGPAIPKKPLFCGECGTENPDTNQFCKNCGKPLKKKQLQPEPIPAPSVGTPAPPHHVPVAQGQVSPKKPGATKKFIIIGAIIAIVIIAAVFLMMQPGSPTTGVTAPATKASEPIHGTISTGAMTPAAQGSISAAGGTITVNQPGSAIDGLKFTAPVGAYPSGQQVTISSAPITGNTFGSNFNPATPMIEIDAGKGYADEPVFVTIPVQIPDGQFAMAFYYDDVSKKLEGVPTSSQDSKSITIATRHFSNILVSLITMSYLDGIKKVDSGFKPGVDTWEFNNPGSYIAPDGYCAGDSATMIWYYTEQRQKNGAPPLNGRYDNNGREKTPLFPMDNTLGVRFASVIHKITNQQKYWDNPGSIISNVSGLTTFREFKYSMLITKEPQFVTIFGPGGGHAIVCYGVSDNNLSIADPNFPGDQRTITLNGNTLSPYTSGANSQDISQNGVTIYNEIDYVAKSAFFSWPTLAAEYAKIQDGTIGNNQFPSYKIKISITNDDGTNDEILIDAGKNSELKRVDVKGKTIQIVSLAPSSGSISNYPDGKRVTFPMTIKEGSNIIGVEGYGEVNGNDVWLGFDWIDINYKPKAKATTATTATTAAPSGQHITSRSYAITNDPACERDSTFNGAYSLDDPYCLHPGQVHSQVNEAGMILADIRCGYPDDKCINKNLYNKGIIVEDHYYITEKTYAGFKYPARVLDGSHTAYYVDGSVMDQWTFKDGVKVGK